MFTGGWRGDGVSDGGVATGGGARKTGFGGGKARIVCTRDWALCGGIERSRFVCVVDACGDGVEGVRFGGAWRVGEVHASADRGPETVEGG